MEVSHIVTVNDSYKQEVRHLVLLDQELVVFRFNYEHRCIMIHKADEYFFVGCKTALDIFPRLQMRDNKALDTYEVYTSFYFESYMYSNLYRFHLRHTKLERQYDAIKTGMQLLINNKDL